MFIKQDLSTTRVSLSPQDALEIIRQLADAVARVTAGASGSSFCLGAAVDLSGTTVPIPGVLSIIVEKRD